MLVGGVGEAAEDAGFEGEGLVEGEACAAVDGFDGGGDGEGGCAAIWRAMAWARAKRSAAGDDFIDEAEAEGFGGGDDVSGEEEAEGGGRADEAGEALGSAVAGDEAELDLGLAEAGGFAGDAEGAGEGELAAAAEGEAVDAGDDGLAAGLDVAKTAWPRRARRSPVTASVLASSWMSAPAAKALSPAPVRGRRGRRDSSVRSWKTDSRSVKELRVEGVEDFGAIESDGGDGPVDGEEEGW